MKDALMQKVTLIPSCLADSSEAAGKLPVTAAEDLSASNEGYCRVSRSAAMIGLAISLSATSSLLLLNQNDAAMATESIPIEPIHAPLPSAIATESDAPQPSSKAAKLSPPAIKHEVQQGESLWQLSQDYQVPSEKIAASNNLAPKANLFVGQSLKIPPVAVNPVKPPNDSVAIAPQGEQLLQEKQNQSLNHLKEARQQLKNSLAQLNTKATEITPASTSPTVTALSGDWDETKAIEIPVPAPETGISATPNSQTETESKQPTPIATAAPTTDADSSTSPEVSTHVSKPEPISTPLPQAATFPTSKRHEASETNTPESISVPKPQQPETANLDHPVSLPVPSPETATVPSYQHPKTELATPKPLENSQPQPNNILPPVEMPQPKVVSATPSKQVYQVQRGDTLNTIARRHGLSVSQLIQANHIANPNVIRINQQLVIPNAAQANHPTPTLMAAQSQTVVVTASVPASLSENGMRADIPTQSLKQPNQSIGGTEAIAIPVQSPTATYTEKLKDDIVKLQQEYQPEPSNNPEATRNKPQPIAVEVNAPTPVNANTRNSEWDSDRRQSPVKPRYQPQAQVVGTAPTGVENYNNRLGTPVGETVGPDLPPLSVPEQYLPNSPTRFKGYIWPTKGVITSPYGWRWGRMHKGIDIAAPIGTPVMAAAGGEVVSAGWNSGGYGNLVKIRHPDNSVTFYAHNSRILVRRGQQVEQGQQISEMGSTGYSTGPHLHFEVHPTGKEAVNPIAFLPKQRS